MISMTHSFRKCQGRGSTLSTERQSIYEKLTEQLKAFDEEYEKTHPEA